MIRALQAVVVLKTSLLRAIFRLGALSFHYYYYYYWEQRLRYTSAESLEGSYNRPLLSSRRAETLYMQREHLIHSQI